MGQLAAWGILGALLSGEAAADEPEGPPLAPPALAAPTGEPAPSARSAATASGPGPVLALPGLTVPRRARPAPRSEGLPEGDAPPLMGPRGGLPAPTAEALPPAGAPAAPAPRAGRPGAAPTLTLESVPSDALDAPIPAPVPSNRQRPARPAVPPQGAPGFFGRMFGTGAPGARREPEPDSSIKVVPRSDPAADAALKRRIERQAREAMGDRVRSVEVRVVGRDVTIRARASRIWQRRSVRRALESLPGLGGRRTTVEVD